MLLAEELVLLALDPRRGRVALTEVFVTPPCLNGALVAELALLNAVFVGKRFTVGPVLPPPGLLRDAQEALAALRCRHSWDQLTHMDKHMGGVWKRVVGGLVDQGVLGRNRPAGGAARRTRCSNRRCVTRS